MGRAKWAMWMCMNNINKGSYKFGSFNPDIGCPSCLIYDCSDNRVASFDKDGNVLVPTIDRAHWQNTFVPIFVHPIPCEYKVTVNGITNYNINESWCQQCNFLNGIYYVKPSKLATWDRIRKFNLDIPLCQNNNEISYCGFDYLRMCLSVSTNDYILTQSYGIDFRTNDPLSVSIEHYNDQTGKIDAPLYIYAVMHLTYNSELFSLENCLRPGYWFVKKLTVFTGDYVTVPGFNNVNILCYDELHSLLKCDFKIYHGDFDGRNLNFTFDGSNLANVVPTNLPRLCNFDNMTVHVEPLSESEKLDIGYEGFPSSFLYHEGFLTQNIFGYPWSYDKIKKQKGIKGHKWLSYFEHQQNIENMGLFPENMYVKFHNVISTNPLPPKDAVIDTCNDCEILNTTHAMQINLDLNNNIVVTDLNFPNFAETGNFIYRKTFDKSICCLCEDHICINMMFFGIQKETQYYKLRVYVTRPDLTLLAIYEGEVYQYEYLNFDVLNQVTLLLYYINTDFVDICNFENSYVTISFSDPDQFKCLQSNEDCYHCAKQTTPEDVLITIPNGWLNYSNECYFQIHGDYILSRSGYCQWFYKDFGTLKDPWGPGTPWEIEMYVSIFPLVGQRTLYGRDCKRFPDSPHVYIPFEDVTIVQFRVNLKVPTSNRYEICEYSLYFAKSYPFSEWGTQLGCLNDVKQYIDCTFNYTPLDFLFFNCYWRDFQVAICNRNNCTDWNSQFSVYITSL
jgi:hypothetical protein